MIKSISISSVIVCSVLLMMVSTVAADITGTFVAATDGASGNTQIDDGTLDGTDFSNTTSTTGFWHDRVGTFDIIGMPSPASGAFQGQNRTTGNPPPQTHNALVTTLSGLTAGENYDIFMIQGVNMNAASGNQHIDAGFSSGGKTTLLEADAVDTGLGLMAGGGVDWRAAQQLIGTTMADGSGNILVYVGATLDAERSIYNGLSYQVAAVPEPGSLTVLASCFALMVARRRRK